MSQSEQPASVSDGPQSAAERRTADSESSVDSECRPSVSIRCPSCGERISATLALSGGESSDARATDDPGEYGKRKRAGEATIAADGGVDTEHQRTAPVSDPALEDELCGKSVQCTDCDGEFELLFYY
ncbi:hypothetical protein [Haloprofundus sp. MHR1]|uniref:hypothetical protein n=1 Tax=Haloprofundus sp. MHR1 TaxID=2572921 RepID=UPI0010BE22F5|nr:hypothetical protein [Haloprofundus sp. MHR1]QCJ47271.1 hypothetical protein FCF25_09145 [Haloprofundus sp. MHR1]